MSTSTAHAIAAIALWCPLVLPAIAAALALSFRHATWTRWADVVAAAGVLASGITLCVTVSAADPVRSGADLLRVDLLSAFMLTVIGAVALTALWGGIVAKTNVKKTDGRFQTLVCLFLGAMSLAVLADHLGIMWVAVEATTVTTAFLVGYRGGRKALEAAWKYVILGSVGVAVALLGMVFLYTATRLANNTGLSWIDIMNNHAGLDPKLVKIGISLAALGFATKAGLAPMHFWLPDAHSQAPAPVSGLMSGVLLSVAFYCILRIQAISDAVLGPTYMRVLLVTGGLLSLAVSCALIMAQRDYKRLLAYSSIEHMGIVAIGAAIGSPLALAAVLLHMLGHGLLKATMFVVAGRILATENSSRIHDVRALLSRRPQIGVPFAAGMIGLMGFPPFPLFFTEVAIVIAGWQQGMAWVVIAALLLLFVTFTGLTRHTVNLLMGPANLGRIRATQASTRAAAGPRLPLALALGASAVLGLTAWPMTAVFANAIATLGAQ